MDFYDDLAENYDAIVDTAGRRGGVRALVEELTSRFEIASALDVACGTGLYALEFARRGIDVVGADLSEAMLDGARRNAEREGLEKVRWVRGPMQELAERVEGPFDAVLCMGNSMPHLLTDTDLAAAVENFARLLKPGGVVLLHLLNYGRILDRGERIVGIDRRGDGEYVRFYDFLPGRVLFNILQIHWRGERCEHRLSSTELRPYRMGDLSAALAAAGFEAIEAFGDLRFGPFDPAATDTLLLTARR